MSAIPAPIASRPTHPATKAAKRRAADRVRKREARAAAREAGELDPRLVDAALSEALVAYAARAGLHGTTVRLETLDGVVVRVSDLVVQAGVILRRRRECTSAEATRALLARLSPARLQAGA
ncbi:hypothetical protein [Methylorubrum aminovorans]